MKNLLILLSLLTGMIACNQTKVNPTQKIKVGVFDRNGNGPWCIIDAIEALKIDPDIDCEIIKSSQILSNEISSFDAIVFPGGSGMSETQNLGQQGMKKIIQLVKENKIAVVGICAGAYIMTNTPDYPCLKLTGYEAIDIEHDNRGHGLAKFSLSDEGKKIFPELNEYDILYCQYYEGPVLSPAKDTIENTSLATMLSDVHTVEGSPANMTNNKPFIVTAEYGKGKVASFVGHPECTPGMRWMLPRMVRWTLGKEMISYPESVVRPDFYKKEIICTKEIQDLQNQCYDNLWKSKEQKLNAMDEMVELACWYSKKWIPGMLRDNDAEVRIKASQVIVQLERTEAISDLEIAIQNENDDNYRKQLQNSLNQLKLILGKNRQQIIQNGNINRKES